MKRIIISTIHRPALRKKVKVVLQGDFGRNCKIEYIQKIQGFRRFQGFCFNPWMYFFCLLGFGPMDIPTLVTAHTKLRPFALKDVILLLQMALVHESLTKEA